MKLIRAARRLNRSIDEYEMPLRLALVLLVPFPYGAVYGGATMLSGRNDAWAGPIFIGGMILTGVYSLAAILLLTGVVGHG